MPWRTVRLLRSAAKHGSFRTGPQCDSHVKSVAFADYDQGVNAALLDVCSLAMALEAFNNTGDVAAALARYERRRLPEMGALMRLMKVRTGCGGRCTEIRAKLTDFFQFR
jgi:hypothetical protein